MTGEIRDTSECCRTEKDTANDFSDDCRLLDISEEPAETLCEDDNDDELDDKKGDWLRGAWSDSERRIIHADAVHRR